MQRLPNSRRANEPRRRRPRRRATYCATINPITAHCPENFVDGHALRLIPSQPSASRTTSRIERIAKAANGLGRDSAAHRTRMSRRFTRADREAAKSQSAAIRGRDFDSTRRFLDSLTLTCSERSRAARRALRDPQNLLAALAILAFQISGRSAKANAGPLGVADDLRGSRESHLTGSIDFPIRGPLALRRGP